MNQPKHTPGPWCWHFDGQSRASLRTLDRGQLIVMDFVRQGMHSAAPRFAVWSEIEKGVERERLGGIMKPLPQIAGSLLAKHPDAQLIAAAPDLLAACQQTLKSLDGSPGDFETMLKAHRAMIAAVAKATGTE